MIDVWINKGSGLIVESIESPNTSIFRLIDFFQEVLIWRNMEIGRLPKKRTNQHQKQRSKMFFMVSC